MKQSNHMLPNFTHRACRAAASFAGQFSGLTTSFSAVTCIAIGLCAGGCTVTSYKSPTGEKFTRASLGTTAAISELTVTGDTNGIRTLDLKGYSSDQAQALGAVTSAAVTAALQSAKTAP